uniref:Autophagy protein 5 n=1 Tax=Acrobeloides nanus TaxID=290746 RepID=A0A914BYW4_9BILA
MDDYEIRRNIWEGKIPVEFDFDTREFTSIRSPQSYFAMLPRISYFPLCLSKALKFLSLSVDEDIDVKDVWLEYNGQILKWHYPIGLLYDMHVADVTLPWVINVRSQNHPDELVHPSKDTMRHIFLQAIKEADQLKHRGQVISSMTKDEHNRLFDSVVNNKFDDFWSVNKRLMHDETNKISYIPIRFYEPGSPFKQVLISPSNEDDSPCTLENAIRKALPTIDLSSYTVISQGINVPLNTPVIWMARNLSYPDNFIHILLRKS